MNSLMKITDVSAQYGVSARALRYYEDAELLASTRSMDYAYRLYDEAAVKRLEQILILRKLGVGIKDIKRIFNTAGTATVLEVLGKKAVDIDEEIALLYEMKEIILAFIKQIKEIDFGSDSDVKQLYEKAKMIETQLTGTDYTGNPSPVNRLFDVADRLAAKTVSRLQIPDNVLKRLLENVYFIFGDGAAVADELGEKYGAFVYHTCDYRYIHHTNSEPRYQPELSGYTETMTDFFARDPEEAMRHEREIVRDFTPMVIMDLIQLTAVHEKIICENDIDIDSIVNVITHAVIITNEKLLDDFISMYVDDIEKRELSRSEKDGLIQKVNDVWGKGKPENPREANKHGLKQIFVDEGTAVTQTAEEVAGYFGW